MKWIAITMLLSLLFAAVSWQHVRYLASRRGPVQDRQSLLHASDSLHVLTFLKVAPGNDLLEGLRALRGAVEVAGAEMVYAGKAVAVLIESTQIPATPWDAVTLVQFPSREAWERFRGGPEYALAFAPFDADYSHGLKRSAALNLMVPVGLLALRTVDLLTFTASRYPFEPASEVEDERVERAEQVEAAFDAARRYGEDAIVIVNLLRRGTPEEQASDRAYGLEMMRLMAEQGHGPMHIGPAVPLDGPARFDTVALVYYPGIDYLMEMVRSTFFNGIVGGKQPGDTLAVPTVPILDRL